MKSLDLLLILLGVLFIGLKLTGYIDWSWWWVTVPLWGPFALAAIIVALVFVSIGTVATIDFFTTKKDKKP